MNKFITDKTRTKKITKNKEKNQIEKLLLFPFDNIKKLLMTTDEEKNIIETALSFPFMHKRKLLLVVNAIPFPIKQASSFRIPSGLKWEIPSPSGTQEEATRNLHYFCKKMGFKQMRSYYDYAIRIKDSNNIYGIESYKLITKNYEWFVRDDANLEVIKYCPAPCDKTNEQLHPENEYVDNETYSY